MDNTHFSPLDYVSVIRRRLWWWATPLALSVVVGLLLVKFLPKEYKSTTTLGVTAPLVSPTLVGQTTSFDNEERLRALQQQLVSAPILSRVAREERLAAGGDVDHAVDTLRANIDIKVPDPVVTTGEPRRLDTFIISYTDAQADRAQRVADRLGHVFVEENSKVRTEHAEDTTEFIGAQASASLARMNQLETRLRKAKEEHMGQLPEQAGANLAALGGLRQQLVSDDAQIRSEREQLTLINRQIDAIDMNTVDEPGARGEAASSPEMRVAQLERDLATARTMYTEKHPEVQRLREELANARKDALAVQQQPQADRLARLQRNPAYLQLVADRDVAQNRIRDLERDVTDTQAAVARYQARMDAEPMVEQQLATIQRDYDFEKQQYSELSSKQRAAAIAANVERNMSGERFAVLEPATLPDTPLKPIPLRVMLGAIAAGLILGAGLTLLREYVDGSVHDERELRDELELPILGSIAHIAA